jgi:predicted  nucleic acid-binding Zn-ribbon protein
LATIELFGQDIFVLLTLLLAFLMTLLALYSYLRYERSERLLREAKEHLAGMESEHEQFRSKVSVAFASRKDLELRIQSLERSLGMAHEDAQRGKDALVSATEEQQRLKKELETTRGNLQTAFENLRDGEREILRLKEELAKAAR